MADIDVNIDIEDDLHDVFQALYDGDEWADWADDALPGADALDVEADPTPQASRVSRHQLLR
jgi:hypothetical protein